MAILTRRLGGDGDPERGYVSFEIDYDDVALVLVKLRCINNSSEAARGRATLVSNPNRTYAQTFPAQTTTEIQIPTNKQNSLDITIDIHGRVDGVTYNFMWPYP